MTEDRLSGYSGAAAVKVPVEAATTAAITLSGLQTVDGVALAAGDRVLVKNQSNGAANGIYIASATAWKRAKDFNGAKDAVSGTSIYVLGGSQNIGKNFRISNPNPIVIGSTALTFLADVLVGGVGGGSDATGITTVTSNGDDSIGGSLINSVDSDALILNRLIAGTNISITGGGTDGNITINGTASGTGDMLAINNLSDLVNVGTARSNLGLGALAELDTVATGQIDNAAVTYAKIQNVSATDTILGRSSSGAGVIEEITCTSAGRAILDDANASAQRTTLGLGTIATQNASSVAITGGSITGMSSPSGSSDVATKGYVDSVVTGISNFKTAVRAASTVNATLSSAFENGDTLDGVVLATGDRILIKNQTTATENGIYTVNASGAPTRATDADLGSELVAAVVVVSAGSQATTSWICTNTSITLGSTNITFVRFPGPQTTGSSAQTVIYRASNTTGTVDLTSEMEAFFEANDGKTIWFPNGVYYCRNFDPNSSVIIEGESKHGVFFENDPDAAWIRTNSQEAYQQGLSTQFTVTAVTRAQAPNAYDVSTDLVSKLTVSSNPVSAGVVPGSLCRIHSQNDDPYPYVPCWTNSGKTTSSNPIATTSGSATVTITHYGHGYTNGAKVRLWDTSGALTTINGLTADSLFSRPGNIVDLTVANATTNTYQVTATSGTASSTGSAGGSTIRDVSKKAFYGEDFIVHSVEPDAIYVLGILAHHDDYVDGVKVNTWDTSRKFSIRNVTFRGKRQTGKVTDVAITNQGSGYETPPTVIVNNTGTGGTGFAATAILKDGKVQGFEITNKGSGYNTPPAITFSGGGGSGDIEISINGNWNWTGPVANPGQTYASAVWPPTLDTYDTQYFDRQVDGSIIFKAPTSGATTSSGTKYTRSELREILPDASNEYEWTSATGGRLECTLAVLEMPTLTVGTSNKTVIGQIHGPNDEMCRLYFDYSTGAGRLYFADDKAGAGTSGTETNFELQDDDGDPTVIPLDDFFTYVIEADTTGCRVTAWHNDVKYVAFSPASNFWPGKDLYFKAGVYNGVGGVDRLDATNRGTGQSRAHFKRISNQTHPHTITLTSGNSTVPTGSGSGAAATAILAGPCFSGDFDVTTSLHNHACGLWYTPLAVVENCQADDLYEGFLEFRQSSFFRDRNNFSTRLPNYRTGGGTDNYVGRLGYHHYAYGSSRGTVEDNITEWGRHCYTDGNAELSTYSAANWTEYAMPCWNVLKNNDFRHVIGTAIGPHESCNGLIVTGNTSTFAQQGVWDGAYEGTHIQGRGKNFRIEGHIANGGSQFMRVDPSEQKNSVHMVTGCTVSGLVDESATSEGSYGIRYRDVSKQVYRSKLIVGDMDFRDLGTAIRADNGADISVQGDIRFSAIRRFAMDMQSGSSAYVNNLFLDYGVSNTNSTSRRIISMTGTTTCVVGNINLVLGTAKQPNAIFYNADGLTGKTIGLGNKTIYNPNNITEPDVVLPALDDTYTWVPVETMAAFLPQQVITTPTYTLRCGDSGQTIIGNSAVPQTFTVPNAVPPGWRTRIVQLGTGTISLVAESGAALATANAVTATTAAYTSLELECLSNTTRTNAQVLVRAANSSTGTGDVTLNGAQTLTNKTLTAPAINGGSLSGVSASTTALSVTQASGVAGTSTTGKLLIAVNGADPKPTQIPYDISNSGLGLSIAGNWSSGTGGVIYQSLTVASATGTTSDVAAFGAKGVAAVSNMDVWAATLVGVTAPGTTGCSAHGLEIGIINQGDSSNNTYGLIIVGDGNTTSATTNDVAIQIQLQRASPSGTGQFVNGIVFNNSPGNTVSSALMFATTGSASYGIHLGNMTFAGSALTIGTGNKIVLDGSGGLAYMLYNGSQIDFGRSVRVLDSLGAEAFKFESSGTLNFSKVSPDSTPRSFQNKYLNVKLAGGTTYYLPLYL